MPFLLNRDDRTDGTTHLTYDLSPTERINMLTPLATADLTVATPPDDLFSYTLARVRPPISKQ